MDKLQAKFWKAERVTSARRTLKQRCVDHMGGKCSMCGYDKCLDALSFHHVDPQHKDFTISSARSFEAVLPELEKCVCLCNNCHAEIHHWMRDEQRALTFEWLDLE